MKAAMHSCGRQKGRILMSMGKDEAWVGHWKVQDLGSWHVVTRLLRTGGVIKLSNEVEECDAMNVRPTSTSTTYDIT